MQKSSPTSLHSGARRWRPQHQWCRCCPRKKIFVCFFIPEPQLARATSARKSHLSAITVRRTWAGPFPSLRRRPNIRPLHLFRIEPRQVRLSRRSAAAEDAGRATQPRPAGDGDACRRPAMSDYVIDVSRVAQELRQAKSRRRLESPGRRRRNLRVSRGKRKRQNDHDPHAVRSTEAGRRQGQCLGYNIIRQPNEIRRQVDYMTQRFSLMRT